MTKQDKLTFLVSLEELKVEKQKDFYAIDRVIALVARQEEEPSQLLLPITCGVCKSTNINVALDQCRDCSALRTSGTWYKKLDTVIEEPDHGTFVLSDVTRDNV